MGDSEKPSRTRKRTGRRRKNGNGKQTSTVSSTDSSVTSSVVSSTYPKTSDHTSQVPQPSIVQHHDRPIIGTYHKKKEKERQMLNLPPFRFILPKPDCIVMDLVGTIVTSKFMSTSSNFREFAKKHLSSYLTENWRKKPLRVVMNYFRGSQTNCPREIKLSEKSEQRDDQIAQARRHILYRMKNEPESPAVALFMLGITEWGYSKKMLVTPVYDEIHNTLKAWSEQYKFPVYVAVGSADFLLMVLTATTDGNLIPFFKGHMNLMDFDGNKATKDFKKLVGLLKFHPNKILYLTRFRSDARRAMECGIMTAVVLRPDFDHSNLIPLVHKWRLKNPSTIITARSPATQPSHSPRTVLPKEGVSKEEKSFMSKLGSALGLEALIGGAGSSDIQRNILIHAPSESDASKIRSHEANPNLHHRSSQILEEDLDFYRVILSLDELEFT